jgi:hypothetical protein
VAAAAVAEVMHAITVTHIERVAFIFIPFTPLRGNQGCEGDTGGENLNNLDEANVLQRAPST